MTQVYHVYLFLFFTDFFNHTFIRKTQHQESSASPPPPLPAVRHPSPPKTVSVVASPPSSPAAGGNNNNNNNNSTTSPEEADDFVLVPTPSQLGKSRRAGVVNHTVTVGDASAQPIPVPSQRGAFLKVSL